MRSKSSRGSTGICRGGKHLSFHAEPGHAVPAFLLQLELTHTWGCIYARRWNLLPSPFLLLQLLLPQGAGSRPLVCGAVSGARMEAPHLFEVL